MLRTVYDVYASWIHCQWWSEAQQNLALHNAEFLLQFPSIIIIFCSVAASDIIKNTYWGRRANIHNERHHLKAWTTNALAHWQKDVREKYDEK